LVKRSSRWCKKESGSSIACGLVEQGEGVVWGTIVVNGMVKLGKRAVKGILQRVEVLLAVFPVQNGPSELIPIPAVT